MPIISGPNGIENKELIFRCCEILEKNNLKLLRGQIYKPLTFPYRSEKYYELGDEGLKILEQIKKNFDVLIVGGDGARKLTLMNEFVDVFQLVLEICKIFL